MRGSLRLLRVPELGDDDGGRGVAPSPELAPLVGNVLLDRLVGAELRLITAASYGRRDELMARLAAQMRALGARPYVVPEGGSNGLGALGYVHAMAELRRQLDLGLAGGRPFDLVVHACGSGGTAAGVALGARRHGVAAALCAMAVCESAATFEQRIRDIMDEARALDHALGEPASWSVDDSAKGPAYAVASAEQRACIVEVARLSGLVLDPVYTGKAFFGLWRRCASGELRGRRVLFLHTGGLPGLLAQGDELAGVV
ncbi:MAG: pyridoxal-phosphate dependent enzyme [Deltaproteobacteria bacterium]|nr:pyridoxal-phosphate dependent enzyme [Deltaproteobacteria bacterium]